MLYLCNRDLLKLAILPFLGMGIRPAGMPSGPQGMRGGFQPPMGGRGGISRGRGLLGMFVITIW